MGPKCHVKVKLGVSMMAPSGTYLAISPIGNDRTQKWEIRDHRFDKDENGEAEACITNTTNDKITIPTGTGIGKVNVIRTRAKSRLNTNVIATEQSIKKLQFPK